MSIGTKLTLGTVIIAVITAYLAYLGAQTSWQYYLTVDECLDGQAELRDARLRVHGRILPSSLQIADDRAIARFDLHGSNGPLHVVCSGPLPDNLQENGEVVVEGRLSGHCELSGDRVMTQCASKYQSEQGNPQQPPRTASLDDGVSR